MDIFNESSEDIFGDLDVSNRTFDSGEPPSHMEIVFYIALTILDFLIGLSSVLANILAIYAISKFPKLKTEANAIILNYSVCHLTYMLVDPVLSLCHALFLDRSINVKWFCMIYQVEETMLTLHFIFVGLLAVDCYVKVYRQSLAGRYQAHFKTIHQVIFAVGFLYAFVNTIACFITRIYRRSLPTILSFCLVAIVTVLVRVVAFANSRRGNPTPAAAEFSMTICSVFVFFWMPICILHIIQETELGDGFVAFLFKLLAFCNPTFNVYLYARLNKHFKVAYYKIYRCQLQNYENDFEDSVADANANNSTVEIIASNGGGEEQQERNGAGVNS